MNKTTTHEKNALSRRDFIKIAGIAGGIGTIAATNPLGLSVSADTNRHIALPHKGMGHGDFSGTNGDVDLNKFDPTEFLMNFDRGNVSTAPDGSTLREWEITAIDKEIEIAPGVFFPAWTFNGQVPGPTFRCTEGDTLRFHLTNASDHPHTLHFHGFHPPSMDGIDPAVLPGGSFTYEFKARPFGVHPYHCHVMSLKKHIHKGLYGTLIIDPPQGRPSANEMVMVMNAFDTTFDNANEVYAVNTVAFHFVRHPIQVKVGELIRIYLTNMTEFDLINSFHLHASMFRLYRTGTSLEQFELTDTVIMGQGERAVLEFTLDDPGKYMFHAHQSEFAELGWSGFFEAVA